MLFYTKLENKTVKPEKKKFKGMDKLQIEDLSGSPEVEIISAKTKKGMNYGHNGIPSIKKNLRNNFIGSESGVYIDLECSDEKNKETFEKIEITGKNLNGGKQTNLKIEKQNEKNNDKSCFD